MSFYGDLTFFSYLFIFLIPAIVLGFTQSRYLKGYRCFGNLLFIYLVYRSDTVQLISLLVYVVCMLFLTKGFLWLKKNNKASRFLYALTIVFAIGPLCIYKISASLFNNNIFGFLGISYICFRVVQIIIEISDEIIQEIPPIQYLEFLLFFPSLSSGPIDRSRRFAADDLRTYSKLEYYDLLETGIFKIALGALYKFVLASICYNLLTEVFATSDSIWAILGHIYIYGFYLFFDFAGYSSMAVGTSYILGIKMPDNFKWPFCSRDIKDFWNRWHITLSTWFRDFIFSRFLFNAIKKKWFSNRLKAASAGFIINMVVMGVWHGFSAQYIEYGLYHGVLLAITEQYQKKSLFYKKNKDKKWYRIFSWFVTLNLVMFGFSIFSGYINELVGGWMKGI